MISNQDQPPEDPDTLARQQKIWDQAAASFDDEPDHGLGPEPVRQAWAGLLLEWLQGEAANILDVGCGTGSVSVLLAGLGPRVTGIDLSPAMLARAQTKARAAGYSIPFLVMNAAAPAFSADSFDGLVCRHLLWALPEPARVLERWARLLRYGGRLLLVEGFWSSGAGLHASDLVDWLPASLALESLKDLSDQPDFWGKPVSDERYALIAVRK